MYFVYIAMNTEIYLVIQSYTEFNQVIPYCNIPGISQDILWPKVYLAIYQVYRKIYFLAKVIP